MMKAQHAVVAAAALFSTPVRADALEGKKPGADILAETTAKDWRTIPAEELLIIKLERGEVAVALSPSLAPNHVKQVKQLARDGFYDGLSFYRVIDGFVAQGGDPFSERKIRKAKKRLKAEFDAAIPKNFDFTALPDKDGYAAEVGFSASLPVGVDREAGRAWHLHCTGAFAFGREDARDTASTEFYITLQPQRYLDRNLSVLGRVVDGMQHLQALRRVDPPESKEDDVGETILSIRVAADLPEAERPAFEILDSARPAFAAYVEARRNRPESFFYHRPNHIDPCQFSVPVRRKAASAP